MLGGHSEEGHLVALGGATKALMMEGMFSKGVGLSV